MVKKYDQENLSFSYEVIEGKPFSEIIKAAANYDVDLIVIEPMDGRDYIRCSLAALQKRWCEKFPARF